MKFLSDIRLLILSLWLGASVFFIGVAQTAFTVLPQRELSGAVVNANLSILNYAGMAVAALLIASSIIGAGRAGKIGVWTERFLLLVLGAACAIGQFVIGYWLAAIRAQIGRPIDEIAADDPLRVQFNMLHEYSVWVLITGMVAGVVAFFIIANRRFVAAKEEKPDIYDFSKEFKV